MIRTDVRKTTTIEEFIDYKSNDTVTYNNFCFPNNESEYLKIGRNVLTDYMSELKTLTVDVELTDEEFIKYQFKPKLLANDVYGTTETYFVIMALNQICNVKDFNMKRLKLLTKDAMKKVLNYIYNAEYDNLTKEKK